MSKKKLDLTEGTLLAVSLGSSGYALGILARVPGDGIAFGYFFGPLHENIPTFKDASGLQQESAILVVRFGDLELLQGTWPILGRLPGWNRTLWPLPIFGRINELDAKAFEVTYADNLHCEFEE